MTLEEFIDIVEGIDPNAVRYDAIGQKGDAYTVYSDWQSNALWADGRIIEATQSIQIDYYTRTPDDPTAERFREAFAGREEIIYAGYTKDFDPESRYIRHIFSCELI